MNRDPCAESRDCVWRSARRLTNTGRVTTPQDLCIAIGDTGQPCGRKATTHLAAHYDEDGQPVPGQPFCQYHHQLIFEAIAEPWFGTASLAEIDQLQAERARALQRIKPARGKPVSQWVYFVARGDKVKIGTSVNPTKRIRDLECAGGSAFDQVVLTPGRQALESRYHRQFAEHRLVGEWFTLAQPIRLEMHRLRIEQERIDQLR